jgi:predicted Fe-Mo cluster-binding NifX family protein
MKVAVASDDGRVICQHFGRTKGFAVFEIEDNVVKSKEYVPNTFTAHASGNNGGGNGNHTHQHGPGHVHSHDSILNALQDCKAVISCGMGQRLVVDLQHAGIEPIRTNVSDVDQAIELYIQQVLKDDPQIRCEH